MYKEKEVFAHIQDFIDSKDQDIKDAYRLHRKIIAILPQAYREDYFFRYLELGGTIGLNLNNYKIYEYPFEKEERFRIIYPDKEIENLEKKNINFKKDFKFVSIPCSLIDIENKELEKFTSLEWENFIKAVHIAKEGKVYDGNKRNIEIDWDNL